MAENEERELKQVVKKDPKNHEAWFKLGNILLDQRNNKQAFKAYEKAVNLEPSNPIYLATYGKALYDYSGNEKGIYLLRGALEIDPHIEFAWVALAKGLKLIGGNVIALETFEDAMEQNPESTEILLELSYFYWDSLEKEKSMECLSNILAINPRFIKAWSMLSICDANLDAKIEINKKILEIDPDDTIARERIEDATMKIEIRQQKGLNLRERPPLGTPRKRCVKCKGKNIVLNDKYTVCRECGNVSRFSKLNLFK